MKDRFCVTCGHNYNDCESIFEACENHPGDLPKIGNPLCPKCCHEDWKPQIYPGYEIKRRGVLDDLD